MVSRGTWLIPYQDLDRYDLIFQFVLIQFEIWQFI